MKKYWSDKNFDADKKYELTDETMLLSNRLLHRIRALKDFGNIKTGDIGGWIQYETNLSQDGTCWVSDEAKVFGAAKVFEDALIYDNARVFMDAQVYGNARVHGNAHVCGEALVHGTANIHGDAYFTYSISEGEMS